MWISTTPADLLDTSGGSGLGCSAIASSINLLEHPTTMTIDSPCSHSLQRLQSDGSPSLAAQWDALVEIEGAGSWPPQPARPQPSASASSSTTSESVSRDTLSCSWWQSYHSLALSIASTGRFVDSEDGLHPYRSESDLQARIEGNRTWLAQELERVVVIDTVMRRLNESLALDSPSGSASSCLGFLACLAYLAHLYRWGTVPVVSLAQDERVLEMPEAISRPMKVLGKRYGLKTSGGCLWTMTLLNVDSHDNDEDGIVYSNMRHLRNTYPDAWDAERLNALIFHDMERLAVPFYRAITALETVSMTSEEVATTLRTANTSLKAAFKIFFDTVREGRIKKDVWMSHAQGFHGWGIDDFDGVSGDHSLLIRTLDAFLGIVKHTVAEVPAPARNEMEVDSRTPSWPSWVASWVFPWRWGSAHVQTPSSPPTPAFTEVPYSDDYLPTRQVAWIAAVRAAELRPRLAREAPEELAETIRLLRLWRAAHTRKAVYYENLDLPERRPMTASGGVGGGVADGKTEDVGEMIRKLEARLKARIEATQ